MNLPESSFRKTVLSNGIRVLTESHPLTRTACSGIFVDLGTRDEPEGLEGAAHFVEHLVFKGTRRRSAYQIARTLEAVGGDLNAFTTRENTCFHATTLSEDVHLAMDVLSDLVSGARFTPLDFEKERQVIHQEIDMSMDNLEEYIFDLYFEEAYRGHSLGRSILGTPKSLMGMSRRSLLEFYQRRYQGRDLIVSVAGSVDHDDVVERVESILGRSRRRPPPRPARTKPKARGFIRALQRPSEQVHILLGLPSCPFRDSHRFESYIVNALLGGGMTSRLYRKVRESRGLAYSVYSYLHSFTDSGLLMVYVGTSPENLQKVIRILKSELESLKEKGIKRSELNLYERQVKGGIIMGAEDMENRMNSLAVNDMVFGHYRSVERVLSDISEISLDSVNKYIDRYFDLSKMGVLVVGDVDAAKTEKWLRQELERGT